MSHHVTHGTHIRPLNVTPPLQRPQTDHPAYVEAYRPIFEVDFSSYDFLHIDLKNTQRIVNTNATRNIKCE